MRPIKILHLITGLEGGGAAMSLVDLARRMNQGRFRLSLCVLRPPTLLSQEIQKMGIPLFHPKQLGACVSLLRHTESDLLHTHLFHADLLGTLCSRRGRPIVSTRHTLSEGREQGVLPQRLYRFMSRRIRRIVAVSNAVKRHLIGSLHIQADKIDLIQQGIDLAAYSPKDPMRLLERIGIRPNGSLIGTACRLVPEKGLETLIGAMASVRRVDPTVRCLIAGEAPRGGDYPKTLRRLVGRLGLEKEVLFVGWQEDLPTFLSGLDLFILPSHSESFGRVLLEAMALKRPVIASRVGGIPEIVEDGKEGCLVPPRDREALARAILHLLGDPKRREGLGREAFRKVQETFSLDRTVHRLSQLYTSLLDGD